MTFDLSCISLRKQYNVTYRHFVDERVLLSGSEDELQRALHALYNTTIQFGRKNISAKKEVILLHILKILSNVL
jgi:deoxycytidylate deaminase